MTSGTTVLSEQEIKDLETVCNFVDLISDAENRWESLYNKIGRCNEKQGDLEHEMENFKLDVFKGYKLYQVFHNLRKHRRVLKNQQEMLKPIIDWIRQNKNTIIALHKVKTEMKKIKEVHENWVYKPRLGNEIDLGEIS